MTPPRLLDFVCGPVRKADRGVFRIGRRLAAFGNRGFPELEPFRAWLRRYGYVEEGFAAARGGPSWVLLLSHPLGPPNAEAVEFGLWEAWAQATANDEGSPPAAAVRDARERAALELTGRHAQMLPFETDGRSRV